MQTQRFAVEFERRTVGIAVRVPGGFMFYASSEEFETLDGCLFPRARVLERELKKVARNRRRNPGVRTAVRPAIAQGVI